MMKRFVSIFLVVLLANLSAAQQDGNPLIDIQELRDVSTLGTQIVKDWHVVDGKIKTRQKLISIRVGDIVPGMEYRVPVRMIVPADRKAASSYER